MKGGETMKLKVFLILALMLAWSGAIYEPGKPITPTHYYRQDPNGTIRVYRSDQILVPTHIVKPTRDGYKVYRSNQIVIPESVVKDWKVGDEVRVTD